MNRPDRRIALITGATRGIGRSLALQLARSGYLVAVNGLRPSAIELVVEEIHTQGGEALGYCADVADAAQVTAMMKAIAEEAGPVDVLIHNAGHLQDGKCKQMTDEEWLSVLNVHLSGAFYCIRGVLPYMSGRGGDIVLMTSTAGLQGSKGQVNYSAAKAGMLGMVWTLAEELRGERIRVNGVAPAALTDMTRPVIEHLQAKHALRNEPFPEFWNVGSSEEVADFIDLLLKQPDDHLTGEIFGVNGTTVTLWQKPVKQWTTNDPVLAFERWRSGGKG
ncbi:SDR family NAD(P)-dependent oxidoreductase [Paenibacillus senegalimassiliensis]|uniref:SDR family NAD(P)-dependent oxidoreductase n=1 Tax=Paenibacillus senegalimassiliensis TaxID=1737426 RepID=UPI00073F6FBC|nr:SDR family NAD(P)-dependent oxidoreductase [Paenibacillus senegalimassiliensis]